MTFAQLLTELARNNIALTVTQDSIRTSVPVSELPDELKEALKLNKADIIDMMTKELIDAAIALGGVVAGEVEEMPGEPVPVQGPDDEIPF